MGRLPALAVGFAERAVVLAYGLEFFNQAFFVETRVYPFAIVGSNAGKGKVGS